MRSPATAGEATVVFLDLRGFTAFAVRLCAEAKAGQILVSQRTLCDVEEMVDADPVREFALKHLAKPLPAGLPTHDGAPAPRQSQEWRCRFDPIRSLRRRLAFRCSLRDGKL